MSIPTSLRSVWGTIADHRFRALAGQCVHEMPQQALSDRTLELGSYRGALISFRLLAKVGTVFDLRP